MGRLGILLVVVVLQAPLGAAAEEEYDPQQAGNPLRVAAYILHPVGVVLDYLIFRPAHWVVSHKPLDEIFGHEEE